MLTLVEIGAGAMGDLCDGWQIENTFLIDPSEINAALSEYIDLVSVHADVYFHLVPDEDALTGEEGRFGSLKKIN